MCCTDDCSVAVCVGVGVGVGVGAGVGVGVGLGVGDGFDPLGPLLDATCVSPPPPQPERSARAKTTEPIPMEAMRCDSEHDMEARTSTQLAFKPITMPDPKLLLAYPEKF
jgi:hypothetical protein